MSKFAWILALFWGVIVTGASIYSIVTLAMYSPSEVNAKIFLEQPLVQVLGFLAAILWGVRFWFQVRHVSRRGYYFDYKGEQSVLKSLGVKFLVASIAVGLVGHILSAAKSISSGFPLPMLVFLNISLFGFVIMACLHRPENALQWAAVESASGVVYYIWRRENHLRQDARPQDIPLQPLPPRVLAPPALPAPPPVHIRHSVRSARLQPRLEGWESVDTLIGEEPLGAAYV
ncbi:hypothetical protein SLS62_003437 [Diatrype stigma]|uniref:Uncharacterized protein n=1 Tax=Diatrype stigma TaxID=117547 RepID=A0AAN9YPZ7_9PEZI